MKSFEDILYLLYYVWLSMTQLMGFIFYPEAFLSQLSKPSRKTFNNFIRLPAS